MAVKTTKINNVNPSQWWQILQVLIDAIKEILQILGHSKDAFIRPKDIKPE